MADSDVASSAQQLAANPACSGTRRPGTPLRVQVFSKIDKGFKQCPVLELGLQVALGSLGMGPHSLKTPLEFCFGIASLSLHDFVARIRSHCLLHRAGSLPISHGC